MMRSGLFQRGGPPRRLGAAVFPALLWAVSTMFLLGSAGWWADDYMYNLRDPVSDQPPGLALFAHWPFWSLGMDYGYALRPLFYQIVPPIVTGLWHHPGLAHLLQAALHAGVCAVLYRWMRGVGIGRGGAGAATLLFMVYPAHFEAALWFSAAPAALATLLAVVFLSRYAAWARGPRRLRDLAVLGLLAAGICGLYEQPITVLAAAPFVAWRGPGTATRRELAALGAPILLGALVAGGYAALVLATAPPWDRGGEGTMVAAAELGPHAAEFFRITGRRLAMVQFAPGAWAMGASELRSAGIWGAAVVIAYAGAALLWWRSPVGAAEAAVRRPIALALAGAAIVATGWLPVLIVKGQAPAPRTFYWPLIGVSLLIALGVDLAARRLGGGRLRVARAAAMGVLVVWLGGCAVMMIGIQSAMAARAALDRRQAAEIRALLPNPAPGSCLIPVANRTALLRTGAAAFDGRFWGSWELPWTAEVFFKRALQRRDVRAAPWRLSPLRGADEEGIHLGVWMGAPYTVLSPSSARVSAALAVPFVVDADGRIRLVTTLVIPPARVGDPESRVVIPQAAGQPALEFGLPRS